MLSRRQKDILQQLERADDFISIRTLCDTCSLSEKTMLSELTVIEAILQEQEIGVLIRKRGSGVSLQLQKNKSRQYEMLLHTRQDQEEAFIVRIMQTTYGVKSVFVRFCMRDAMLFTATCVSFLSSAAIIA